MPSILICGAGIAGISTAYHLAVEHELDEIVLVDERPPLSLTSDKSTECYRNWWPGPGDAMVRLMNQSIDWLERWAEQSNNQFLLNRRGYLFATSREQQAEAYLQSAHNISQLGAGPLRLHRTGPGNSNYQPSPPEGYQNLPIGADLLLDPELIQQHYPQLSADTVAALHTRRCGWFSAQQLGQYLLAEARKLGVTLLKGKLTGIDHKGGKVRAATIKTENGDQVIGVDRLVIAAGPLAPEVAGLMGISLPIFNELHSKVSIADNQLAVPRESPLMIWSDPQQIPWSPQERAALAEDPETEWLLDEFPPGVHTRPDGPDSSPILLMLWTYHTEAMPAVFPPPHDEVFYPEIVLRGLTTMLPDLSAYLEKLPKPYVDGGYYAKTEENRPLIGPLAVEGAYLIGALSGFGLMAAPAAGELAAAHVSGGHLPDYQHWFRLERYQDPEYQQLLQNWGSSGQL